VYQLLGLVKLVVRPVRLSSLTAMTPGPPSRGRARRAPASGAVERLERSLATVARGLADLDRLGEIAARSGHHLPPASWALLEYLDADGPLRVSQIAACHGVDISSITPRLKALEGDGLVERHADERDGRVSMIHISSAGRAALRAVHAARRDLIAASLGEADDASIDAAAAVLESLAARISRPAGAPGPVRSSPLG
jgi:DNA-binding MarR family transcriptional regulator